ncbi:hypothetical protein BSF41_01020 [Flavobacterium sp. ACN2]|nr:hypothetical protein BSF41_01020 [Flavobacterium sp. ACN2]
MAINTIFSVNRKFKRLIFKVSALLNYSLKNVKK